MDQAKNRQDEWIPLSEVRSEPTTTRGNHQDGGSPAKEAEPAGDPQLEHGKVSDSSPINMALEGFKKVQDILELMLDDKKKELERLQNLIKPYQR